MGQKTIATSWADIFLKTNTRESDGQNREDIRLIAAAPELVLALQDLYDACEYWENQDDPVLLAARLALARARGDWQKTSPPDAP